MPHGDMTTSRLEALSDGVIAVILTIMVREMRAPAQPTPGANLQAGRGTREVPPHAFSLDLVQEGNQRRG